MLAKNLHLRFKELYPIYQIPCRGELSKANQLALDTGFDSIINDDDNSSS